MMRAFVLAFALLALGQGAKPAMMTPLKSTFDMSAMTLPVVRSMMEENGQIEKPNEMGNGMMMPSTQQLAQTNFYNTGPGPNPSQAGDDSLKTILPLMMMMSMRRRSYGGMGGYMGGMVGGMGGGMVGGGMGGMGYPYQQAMAYPMQQAHMMYSNPFLDRE